jgi:O-antigen ligase
MSEFSASLRRAPATVPALAALVFLIAWATDQAGYPVTHWAPGGIVMLGLLALAALLVRLRVGEIPAPVRVALGCLAAYTALSFLSILWAADRASAWEGADRTLLYLLVFALFALWRQRATTAATLLVAWTLALVGLGVFVLLHLADASQGGLVRLFGGGRLTYPSGYANANAAQWLMAFWPALLMARERRLHWALRGLLAGGAVLLAELALLSQSRGSLYATPVVLALVLALLPGRVRTFAVLVPVAGGIALAAPGVLHVGDRLRDGQVVAGTLHTALTATALSALVVGLLVALAAALEARSSPASATAGRIHRVLGGVALAALAGVVVAALLAFGNPIARLEHAWHSFKGGYSTEGHGSRLVSGLGSNRYDFFRVALDEFAHHPVAGIGADNFQQQYLRHGRSSETPRYPHSVELRTLTETGLVGAALALAGLLGALLAVARALRGADELARAVAAAALAGFGYWVVHGSFDWFFEFAGLAAPAFALLGLACALAPRPKGAERREAPRGHRALLPAAAVLALCAVASLAGPWLSQKQVQSAARVWTRDRQGAYDRLEEAADLNPLSDQPYLVAGSIALRYGEQARAKREFGRALGRSRDDVYATLELGAIASSRGERPRALALLRRAVRLSPREPLAAEALAVVRRSETLSVDALNRSILLKATELS